MLEAARTNCEGAGRLARGEGDQETAQEADICLKEVAAAASLAAQ